MSTQPKPEHSPRQRAMTWPEIMHACNNFAPLLEAAKAVTRCVLVGDCNMCGAHVSAGDRHRSCCPFQSLEEAIKAAEAGA